MQNSFLAEMQNLNFADKVNVERDLHIARKDP